MIAPNDDVIGISRVSLGRRRLQTALAASLGVAAASVASAASVFGSGPYALPEGVSAGPSGTYLVSDLRNETVYQIPAAGGAPTGSVPVGFLAAGTVDLSSYYGDLAGTYLVYGSNASETEGLVAQLGPSGAGPVAANAVIDTASLLVQAAVAPSAFGSIAAGQVVFSTASEFNSLDVLSANALGASRFTFTGPGMTPGVGTAGIAFAPTGFGAHGGDLFVSEQSTGEIDVINAEGVATRFATLALPPQSNTGLRQIAFAPAGFGNYGGDLFVSVAGRNGGGGLYGAIDILNGSGQIVAHYSQGSELDPLDPRGLDFTANDTLLFANADPQIIVASPGDFVPGPAAVPEPATWTLMLIGFGALGAARRVARRVSPFTA
jgi:hypothetical protein